MSRLLAMVIAYILLTPALTFGLLIGAVAVDGTFDLDLFGWDENNRPDDDKAIKGLLICFGIAAIFSHKIIKWYIIDEEGD